MTGLQSCCFLLEKLQGTKWFTTSSAETMSGSLVLRDERCAVKLLCMYWYLPGKIWWVQGGPLLVVSR